MIDYEKKFEEETGLNYESFLPCPVYIKWLKSQLTDKDKEITQLKYRLKQSEIVIDQDIQVLRNKLALRDIEIAELKDENELTTKERDNHFRDIIKLENELSELKVENKRLASSNLKLDMENQSLGRSLTAKDKEIDELKETILNLGSEVDNGDSMYSILKKAHEALKAKISKGIQVDIAYTGSTNIITNLPNALYGKFILIGLTEMENDDD